MISNSTESGYFRYLHIKAAQMKKACSGTFELTAHCNFNCKMCYVHQLAADRSKELSADEWIRIAKDAADGGMLFLLLTGGEPLLRADFDEIYRKCRELGLLVSVNTNGYLIDESKLRLFSEYPPRRLNISLYGASDETYSALCGIEGYTKVSGAITALRKAGVYVKVNMSVTELNRGDVGKVFDFTKALDIPLQPAGYMFPPQRTENESAAGCRMPPETAAGCELEHLKRYKSPGELHEYVCRALEAPGLPEDCEEGEKIPCRAGKCAFWITWDGKMLPCGMMTGPAADVRKEGFAQAWENTVKAAAEIRLPARCSSCRYRCVCNICAAKCFCETGSFRSVPEYVCRLAKEKYRLFCEIKDNVGGNDL